MESQELSERQFLSAMDELEENLIGATETVSAEMMRDYFSDIHPHEWNLKTRRAFLQAWSKWGGEIVGWVKAVGEEQDAHLLWRTANPSDQSYRICTWLYSGMPAGCIRNDIHVYDDMKETYQCLGVVRDGEDTVRPLD